MNIDTAKTMTEVVYELHHVRAALSQVGRWVDGQDEFGLAYIIKNLAATLQDRVNDLENIEGALKNDVASTPVMSRHNVKNYSELLEIECTQFTPEDQERLQEKYGKSVPEMVHGYIQELVREAQP